MHPQSSHHQNQLLLALVRPAEEEGSQFEGLTILNNSKTSFLAFFALFWPISTFWLYTTYVWHGTYILYVIYSTYKSYVHQLRSNDTYGPLCRPVKAATPPFVRHVRTYVILQVRTEMGAKSHFQVRQKR